LSTTLAQKSHVAPDIIGSFYFHLLPVVCFVLDSSECIVHLELSVHVQLKCLLDNLSDGDLRSLSVSSLHWFGLGIISPSDKKYEKTKKILKIAVSGFILRKTATIFMTLIVFFQLTAF
jgi:hypothetical protein